MTNTGLSQDFLTIAASEIEQYLHGLFETKEHYADEMLQEAARYAVFSGGKRLRPLLCLATAQTLGVDIQYALAPAAALELIHCYSLIHDDLPSMDNDDFRRGKPTVHRVYTEGHAILTGDFLLTYAFEVAATAPHLTESQRLALVTALARCGGSEGLIGGQCRDLAAATNTVSLDELEKLHSLKTGRLFETSLLFGAIIADAPLTQQKALVAYGTELGIAFQIADDLNDLNDSKKKRGPGAASDVRNNKCTYATEMGAAAARARIDEHHQKALALLETIPHDTALLRPFFSQIISSLS